MGSAARVKKTIRNVHKRRVRKAEDSRCEHSEEETNTSLPETERFPSKVSLRAAWLSALAGRELVAGGAVFSSHFLLADMGAMAAGAVHVSKPQIKQEPFHSTNEDPDGSVASCELTDGAIDCHNFKTIHVKEENGDNSIKDELVEDETGSVILHLPNKPANNDYFTDSRHIAVDDIKIEDHGVILPSRLDNVCVPVNNIKFEQNDGDNQDIIDEATPRGDVQSSRKSPGEDSDISQAMHAGFTSSCDVGKKENIIEIAKRRGSGQPEPYLHEKNRLKCHMKIVSGEKLYSCNVCHKSFVRKHSLRIHFRTHSDEKRYSCNMCSKSYAHKRTLKDHLKIHSRDNTAPRFSCDKCTKSFYQKKSLNTHLITHSQEKLHSCGVCSKSFTRKFHLKAHLNTHSRETLYSCDVCTKTFTSREYIKKHFRIHSGEKPYSCKICQKSFALKHNLKTHLNRHTREKLFSCEVCMKSFTEKKGLKTHLNTHFSKKRYSCAVCAQTYTQKKYLYIHLNTHTRQKLYSCVVCKRSFTQKKYLKNHLNTHSINNIDNVS